MKNLIANPRTWRKATIMGLATAVLAGSIGGAGAQSRREFRGDPSYGPYQGAYAPPRPALSRWDRARFDHSGTRGREGLGASPLRPEGPGNVSN